MADSLKNDRPHTATSKDKKGKTTKASNANLKILMDTLSLFSSKTFTYIERLWSDWLRWGRPNCWPQLGRSTHRYAEYWSHSGTRSPAGSGSRRSACHPRGTIGSWSPEDSRISLNWLASSHPRLGWPLSCRSRSSWIPVWLWGERTRLGNHPKG